MKKLIASLLVLVFGATMVMAESLPGKEITNAIVSYGSFEFNNVQNGPDVNFADVSGSDLTEAEISAVQGEAVWMVVVIAAVLITVAATKAY